MPLNGRVQCIDYCIHQIVAALNAGGVRTVASCCGHEKMPGNIRLEDGRQLIILSTPNDGDWNKVQNKQFEKVNEVLQPVWQAIEQ